MASRASSGWIATFVVLIPLFIVGWFMLPLFLPMWRWQHIDWPVLATELKLPEERISQKFSVVVRSAPRGLDDPIPFQITALKPTWQSMDPKTHDDENNLMVRVSLISDRTGEVPSGLTTGLGSTERDRWFRVEGWRLPPGTFGTNKKRPVFVADMATWEKMNVTDNLQNESKVRDRKIDVDDAWEDRDDGFRQERTVINE
jgi:hypothetical protein